MISTRKKKKKVRRKAKAQPVYLTEEELRSLLELTAHHSLTHALFLLITYWHGLRVSETLKVRRADIADGYLTVQRLKGSMKTRQKLVEHADAALNEARAMAVYLGSFRSLKH